MWGALGAGAYLAKYLVKEYDKGDRDRMAELGFARRLVTSRNWPRGAQMRRAGTASENWKSIGWDKGDTLKSYYAPLMSDIPEMKQVGTDMAKTLKRMREDRKVEKYMDATAITKGRDPQHR